MIGIIFDFRLSIVGPNLCSLLIKPKENLSRKFRIGQKAPSIGDSSVEKINYAEARPPYIAE